MKDFIQKHLMVLIAFSLPVLLIIGVAVNALIPSLWLTTNYNFIYAACSDDGNYYYYDCNDYLKEQFSVVDGKLFINDVTAKDRNNDGEIDTQENYTARLFLHNTDTNETREITPEEARTYTLNELITSPDGVTVSSHYDRGADLFLVFDSGSSYGYYLTKGNSKRRLHLFNADDRYYYQNNFEFIGWIMPPKN
jgi:hypothetical protein